MSVSERNKALTKKEKTMNWENYENKVKYPSRADFKLYNLYKNGRVLETYVNEEMKNNLLEFKYIGEKVVVEAVFDETSYFASRAVWDLEERRVINDFWKDFAEESGISMEHPKFELLRSVAWEHGHSSGFNDVYNYAIQLVDFLK